MNINSIIVSNLNGYILCESNFYKTIDICDCFSYRFTPGVNVLRGEIDSGNWAVSYLLSMMPYKINSFTLFETSKILIEKNEVDINKVANYSLYLDQSYPLFSDKRTINEIVSKALKQGNKSETPDDIRNLFHIDIERFNRRLGGVGNEVFKAMSAIGYCFSKDIFCFPWLSKKRFDSYHNHMEDLFSIIKSLNKIIILPLGK